MKTFSSIDRDALIRKIGMGRPIEGTRQDKWAKMIGFVKSAIQCPTYTVPVIDNVTLHFQGPVTDTQITQTFGPVINPLGANPEQPPPGVIDVDSTFAQPGEFQTPVLICGIQWRFDFEPQAFTVLGNSWTAPAAAGAAIPVSPDDFNVNATADTVASGPLGLATGQTMTQSALEWAWWAELACFYMSRGYNLQWQWGNRQLLINDVLRYTAYVPSNAQEGSASSSDVDVNFAVRRTNNYYRNVLTSPQIFLAADRTRIGNMTLGAPGGAGSSVFRPTRAYEFVGATYGGAGLRQYLKGNFEFRKLSTPFLIGAGIPIGLKAVANNASDDQLLMRQYLSATYGFGGAIPADFTPDQNIAVGASVAGTAGTTGAEPSFDTPVAPQSERLNGDRTVFKGGSWKLTVAFKGFELTPSQADVYKDPDFQSALASECGCACYSR